MSADGRGRRALVTGAAGFVGGWLVPALVEAGWQVTATSAGPPELESADERLRQATWHTGDVRDAAHLAAMLDESQPDAIIHLAGISFVPEAGRDPGAAAEVNVVGAARLLGLVRERRNAGSLDPVVLVVGSAEQYGRHASTPSGLRETDAQRPHTVYAATKVAQEAVALEAWRSDGVRVIATRSFNHSGPGQSERFLLPGLVARARHLAPGAPLLLGNQEPVRDFLHVGDVVAAYIALVERGRAGEVYNVASGRGRSVGDIARAVLARAAADARVESDPALVRPADVPWLVGDAAKLRADTGWSPRHTFDDLLDDLIAAGSGA